MKKNNYNRKFRSKGKLAYSTKNYNNPFFAKKTKRRNSFDNKNSNLFKIVMSAIILIIFCFIWFLFFSKYFKISNIQINGEGRIPIENIKSLTEEHITRNFYILLKQDNLFLFNKEDLKKNLEEKYAFDNLEISKKMPHTIVINFKERDYALIWFEDGKYYFTDSTGHILSETSLEEAKKKDYPIIQNQSNNKIINNQIPLENYIYTFVADLNSKFKNYQNDFKIDYFILDNQANAVKIALVNGPQLYFSVTNDIEKQINKLLVIKKERLKNDFNKKVYIDLRIGDSVYYQ